MSRLSAYLDRRLPSWRDLRTPSAKILGIIVRWASFARPRQLEWLTRTRALEPESFENYCTSVRAAQVASGEALLAEPFRAPRSWRLPALAPVLDYSHSIIIDGVKQPSF